jgi:RNA polymerase sigma-70 factor (TIGR02960 family)
VTVPTPQQPGLADDSTIDQSSVSLDEATRAYRRELHVHCYRMLGSFEEAEDLVQETYLRAWRGNPDLAHLDNPRAWLYKVATNLCLDTIKAKRRRVAALGSFRDLPWLEPYPDRLLDQADRASAGGGPDTVVIARETIELTFIAVIQLLPPSQRAALVLRDVLSWSVPEVAETLDLTATAVNSLLQRARATLRRHLPTQERETWTTSQTTSSEKAVLDRYVAAYEIGDLATTLDLIADDIRITMPPAPYLFEGRADVQTLVARARDTGSWRLIPVSANRQPAAACYLRVPGGTTFTAFKIDVLSIVAGKVAAITTFGVKHFEAFGLPPELPPEAIG